MTVSDLAVGQVASKMLNDLGRTLTLTNVNLGFFAWQIYCENNSGLVTIQNSVVNEIGALQNSNVQVINSTLQLGDLASAAPGSQLLVNNSDVWNHVVQAMNGGNLTIENSTIHGNYFTASGCTGADCSTIALTNDTEENNGTQSTCSGNNIFQANGIPNCDPLNPLEAPSTYVTSNGGVINK